MVRQTALPAVRDHPETARYLESISGQRWRERESPLRRSNFRRRDVRVPPHTGDAGPVVRRLPSATAICGHSTIRRGTCSRTYPEGCGTSPATTTPSSPPSPTATTAKSLPAPPGSDRCVPGDFLFFLVRLESWLDGKPSGRFGFYLIGYLHVAQDDWALRQVTGEPSAGAMALFGNNAHVIRGRSAPSLWDGFWVFRGAGSSRRFRTAVPVTREFCQAVFRKADGGEWRWNGGRSDLQVIGSYTRACRRVLDPADPEDGPRARILWEWVEANRG